MSTSEIRQKVAVWLKTFCEIYSNWQPLKYSGRNMYGKYCFAVTLSEECDLAEGIATFFLEVGQHILEEERAEFETVIGFEPELDIIFKELRGYRTDSLGRGEILYFPNIPWIED